MWVRGLSDDASADQALGSFQRFPTWWALLLRRCSPVCVLDCEFSTRALAPADAHTCTTAGGPACTPSPCHRMWRNTVMAEFVDWLRRHNEGLPAEARAAGGACGLYGVDVYSLHSSGERLYVGASGWCAEAGCLGERLQGAPLACPDAAHSAGVCRGRAPSSP